MLFNMDVGSIDIASMSSTYIRTHSYYSSPLNFTAGLSQTSGSAGLDWNPISSNFRAINALKAALTYFKPYEALTTINTFPCSGPNSGPALSQCFSKLFALRKAF